MKLNSFIDYKVSGRIFRIAENTHAAAELIYQEDINRFSLQAICFYALACELYLKSTDVKVFENIASEELVLDSEVASNLRGHKLDSLLKNNKNIFLIEKIKIYFEKNNSKIEDDALKFRDYFEHSRYGYEKISGHPYDITGVRSLCSNLRLAIYDAHMMQPKELI